MNNEFFKLANVLVVLTAVAAALGFMGMSASLGVDTARSAPSLHPR